MSMVQMANIGLTMNNSQTAVVRGALMKGLAEVKGLTAKLPRVRARKARKHYGTECITEYKERQYSGDDGHSPLRKKSNPFDGVDYVEVMKWFLNKVCLSRSPACRCKLTQCTQGR